MDKEVLHLYALHAYSARLLRTYLHLVLKPHRPTQVVNDISREFLKSNRKAAVTSIDDEHQAMRIAGDYNHVRYVEII